MTYYLINRLTSGVVITKIPRHSHFQIFDRLSTWRGRCPCSSSNSILFRLKAWWLSGKLGVGAELLDHLVFVENCCLRFRILVVICISEGCICHCCFSSEEEADLQCNVTSRIDIHLIVCGLPELWIVGRKKSFSIQFWPGNESTLGLYIIH